MPMPSFLTPARGPSTPESVSRRRRMAEGLMGASMDNAPVGHWTDVAGRMAQALAGGYGMRKAEEAETQGEAAARQRMIKLLGSRRRMVDELMFQSGRSGDEELTHRDRGAR
jgi:hypothetical protein